MKLIKIYNKMGSKASKESLESVASKPNGKTIEILSEMCAA
jgi:hypothetical protein